jgi:hypothetical protein
MDSGREAGDQGQGIHLDADRAIPERFLQLDGDQAILGEGDVFLGDGRAKDASNAIDKFSWRASVSREALYQRAPGSLRRQR